MKSNTIDNSNLFFYNGRKALFHCCIQLYQIMKKSKAIISILTLFICISSCVQQTPAFMKQANTLYLNHTDSAYLLLTKNRQTIKRMDKSIQMNYHLLMAKIQEKRNERHTTDSILKTIAQYFEEHGPFEQQLEGYYYLGCTYRDMNETTKAMDYFQNILDISEDDSYIELHESTHFQLGNIYASYMLEYEALEAYQNAYRYSQIRKDSISSAKYLKKIGDSFIALNQPDSVLYYYDLSYSISPDTIRNKNLNREKANLYIQLKDFEKAKQILSKNDSEYKEWGNYYHAINQKDSATLYYTYAINQNGNSKSDLRDIYLRLSIYSEEQGNFPQAYYYYKRAENIQDTLQQELFIQTIKDIYSLRKLLREKKEMPTIRYAHIYPTIIFILLIGLSVLCYFYIREKKPKKPAKYAKDMNNLYTSEIYQLIKAQAHNPDFKMNDKQWQELQAELDKNYNHFTARLYEKCPKLSETELHVCFLLKLSIAPTDIAHIVVKQVGTITNIRTRLHEKICGKPGNAKQLDDYIRNF